MTLKNEELAKKNQEQNESLNVLLRRQDTLLERVMDLECRSMSNNLVFSGIPEARDESNGSIRRKINELFNYMGIEGENIQVLRCHRIGFGRKNAVRPRDIVAVFELDDKYTVLHHAKFLKGHEPAVFINEQFPYEINRRRNILRPIMKLAKDRNMRASLAKDKLKIEGKVYTINDLDKLPEKVNMAEKSIVTTGTHVLFHGWASPLSNFHRNHFTLDKVTYCCVEQYYQRTKALMVQDHSKAAEIMLTRDPMLIKAIGDAMPGTQMWTDGQLKVMEKGLYAKFTQNANLRQLLIETEGKTLAEASRDKFWGIGWRLRDPDVGNSTTWTGKNNMGKLLESVRETIK